MFAKKREFTKGGFFFSVYQSKRQQGLIFPQSRSAGVHGPPDRSSRVLQRTTASIVPHFSREGEHRIACTTLAAAPSLALFPSCSILPLAAPEFEAGSPGMFGASDLAKKTARGVQSSDLGRGERREERGERRE